MWNERYSGIDYVYGEEPNVFFSEQIQSLKPGKLILPCEGEGRNAVYAASIGWEVNAFDSSTVGRIKAMELANKKQVFVNYIIDDAAIISFPENNYDVVAFIYAHLPSDIRKPIHQKAMSWLKPGGKIILECFNPKQLNNLSGGPKDLSMLYTEDMLKEDFKELKIEMLQTESIVLNEGKYHQGVADVIRFVGAKL